MSYGRLRKQLEHELSNINCIQVKKKSLNKCYSNPNNLFPTQSLKKIGEGSF